MAWLGEFTPSRTIGLVLKLAADGCLSVPFSSAQPLPAQFARGVASIRREILAVLSRGRLVRLPCGEEEEIIRAMPSASGG